MTGSEYVLPFEIALSDFERSGAPLAMSRMMQSAGKRLRRHRATIKAMSPRRVVEWLFPGPTPEQLGMR